jgi:hypothetical protein
MAFDQKFPIEKGSVRRCVVMMQQPVILSPNFRAKFSHISTLSPLHVTAVCGNDCLACHDEFFINNPLDVKENDEQAFDVGPHQSRRFLSALNRACHSNTRVRLKLSSPSACIIIARISVALFPRFAQNLMLLLCRFLREIASGQIHNSNKRSEDQHHRQVV